jgi:hypothetical protein
MSTHPKKNHRAFLIVISVAFIAGLAAALAVLGLWKYYPGTLTGQSLIAAIAVCPPFFLTGVLEATSENTLAVVMTVGTIIFANGFLYAGLSSFAYFLAGMALRRRL